MKFQLVQLVLQKKTTEKYDVDNKIKIKQQNKNKKYCEKTNLVLEYYRIWRKKNTEPIYNKQFVRRMVN